MLTSAPVVETRIQHIPVKKKFYMVFGPSHPLHKHWIEIEASAGSCARKVGFDVLGGKFEFIYESFAFDKFKEKYPLGKTGETLIGD